MNDKICAICLNDFDLPYTLACKHTFCYLCLKRAAKDNNMMCPTCRALIPTIALEEAKVSDKTLSLKDGAGKWLYSGKTRGWWFFDSETDKIIEDAWKHYIENNTLSHASIFVLGRNYTIDFNLMIQSAPFGRIRSIKRIDNMDADGVIKGIAGLQIVKEENMPQLPKPEYPDPNKYIFNPEMWTDSFNEEEITISPDFVLNLLHGDM